MFLPFLPKFLPLIASGRKTMTARNRRYGSTGEIVQSPAGPLRLTDVRQMKLGDVARDYWRAEGCASPREFADLWVHLNPERGGFDPEGVIWLHKFEREAVPE